MAINKNKVMDAARKAYEKGQYDRAIKEYLRVVKEDPKDVRVWLKIGDLYAKKGAKQDATDTYIKVAEFYSEQGFYLKAVAVYKQILKLDPRLVEVNLKLAELYRQLGLLSDAMQHFEMVAAFFHREGKTKEALATIRQLVELDPENVATRIKLAELYSKEGMVEDAVGEFRQACDYLRRHNRQDDYIKVAERLLFHKTDDIALSRELAGLYLRRSDPRRALAKLQVCFKADPRDVETLGLLAQAFQKLEQRGKTVSVLKELARVLTEKGERAKAEEVHRKILAYVPNDPDSLAFIGETSPASRPAVVPERAPLELSEVEIRRPRYGGGSPVGRVTGAMPLVHGEEPDSLGESSVRDQRDSDFELDLEESSSYEAVEGSTVGGEMHADEIEKILTETDVYVKYGLHQKAVDHLRRVFTLDPDNIEGHERLKDIFLGQGKRDEAARELLILAELSGAANPERASGYLRELSAIDPEHRGARDVAARFGLSTDAEAPAVGGELDFDDLDFEDGASAVDHGVDEVLSGLSAETAGRAEPTVTQQEDVGYAPGKSVITQEVDLEQVEEAVPAVPEHDALEFDLDPPGDPLAPSAEPVSAVEAYLAEDLPFDPEDAAAFDAEVVDPAPSEAPPYLDYEPEGDFAFEPAAPRAPSNPYDPPLEGPVFGVTEAEVEVLDEFDAAEVEELDDDDLQELESSELEPLAVDELAAAPVPAPTAEVAPALDDSDDFSLDSGDFGPAPNPYAPGYAAPADYPDPAAELEPELHTVEDAGAAIAEPVDPTATATAAATGTSLEDDLDEADFFVSQGLFDEARDILRGLLGRYPGHPLVTAKLQDVDQMAAEGGAAEAPPEEPVATAPVKRPRAQSVILEKPIEDEDAETHYDLGLAYKEMGLHDEAIKAFQKVIGSPGREVQCHLMIGLCQVEQGNFSEAINQFKAGLYVDRITSAEKFGLYYEIGAAYEALQDPREALYYYEMVVKKDPGYRDVADRVEAIRAAGGGSPRERRSGLDDETSEMLDELRIDGTDRSR